VECDVHCPDSVKERVVNGQIFCEVLLCEEYERLLKECQKCLHLWNERSEEIRRTRQTGDAAGRELLSLQARFAKSYALLRRHIEECEECQLVARLNPGVLEMALDGSRSLAN
jgi:hypothetical protein